MRRFHFRLQPIKRLREFEEQRERLLLAQEIQRLRELEEARRQLDERRDQVAAAFPTLGGVAALRAASEQYASLEAQSQSVHGLIDIQAADVEAQRERYQQAKIRVRAMERLEERARERHTHESLAEEQRFLDELATIGASR